MCHWVVRWVAAHDTRNFFYFAPLEGETAKKLLAGTALPDSIVLLREGEKELLFSQAVFEIAWQLGGIWTIPGLLSFMPRFALLPFDMFYKFVARHRDRSCSLDLIRQNNHYLERFLP